ncbi:DUF4352 domain-containing protein [Yimella sp. cx-573]|nr:DUF4352 domain-containing protein [Yimella sp. cx-573]
MNNEQHPGTPQPQPNQWHGQQPPPYGQGGGLPPAPPYVNQPKQKNWFMRHKVLTGIGALLLIGGIGSALGGGNKGTDAASDTSTSSTSAGESGASAPAQAASSSKAKETKQEKKDPGLNTPVRDGKFEFTVTKVQTGVKTVGDQYLNQQAQGQYVLISVTVKNIGDKPQTMFDSNQKLTDAQGRQFSPDSGAAIYMKNNDIWMKEINPGNTLSGTLVYDMPADAKPVKLELHDSMFSGGTTVSLTT